MIKRPAETNPRMPSLKEQHEIAIANEFLKVLGVDGGFIRHGLDGMEPDVIYSIAGKTLGIEIATAYYNNADAKWEWDIARGITKFDSHSIAPFGPLLLEPDKQIAAAVQREIDDKCSKRYSSVEAAWLCIYQNADLTDVGETKDLTKRVEIPSEHPFERIYLGFYANWGDGGGFCVHDLLVQRHGPAKS